MASKALQTTKAPAKRATSSGVIEEASYVISSIPTVAEFTQALRGGGKLFVDEDATETGSFLAEALDRAESGADVFSAGGGLLHVKEHLGEVFTILGIDAVRNSDFEGGVGVYLIVSAIDSEGELVKLDIGQTDPMGKLRKPAAASCCPAPRTSSGATTPSKSRRRTWKPWPIRSRPASRTSSTSSTPSPGG